MIVFTDDSHRDLKVKEAAASMARPAGAGKKEEEADASEPRVPLACLFPIESTAEARPVGAGKGDSLWKEGEMLKLREDFWEAERLWSEKLVPGSLGRWLKRKKSTQVPAVAGKKRKVVRVILPDDYIDYIKENPGMMRELSDEEMAKCPERFRQTYAITKVINAKNRAYQQALIDQYRAFGFAYDEKEVTDNDEEVVVKN